MRNRSFSYERAATMDDEEEEEDNTDDEGEDEDWYQTANGDDPNAQRILIVSSSSSSSSSLSEASRTLRNFILMSILFSANHGCVVACLALATSRLGVATGAWQSGILYSMYTVSSLLGSTYIVKKLGPKQSVVVGMVLLCAYVGCFYSVATLAEAASLDDHDDNDAATKQQKHQQQFYAYLGAGIGGLGGGFIWVAQGVYFGRAAEDHARLLHQPLAASTALLGGIFAFVYLLLEVVLRLLSTILLAVLEPHNNNTSSAAAANVVGSAWKSIFAIYTAIAISSTLGMILCVRRYPPSDTVDDDDDNGNDHDETHSANGDSRRRRRSVLYQVTVAGQLLIHDPKMKYMIGLNAVFGFVSAFLNSYVNSQIVPVALDDPDSKYIGILSSWVPIIAAGASLLFGALTSSSTNGRMARIEKGTILILGAVCFAGVALPFLFVPDPTQYGWVSLLTVYTLHGIGRATFEGTMKAVFVDFFPTEKEGAFANIILQNGLAGSIGYILTLHNIVVFEIIIVVTAVAAVVGLLRAADLYRREHTMQPLLVVGVRESDDNYVEISHETIHTGTAYQDNTTPIT